MRAWRPGKGEAAGRGGAIRREGRDQKAGGAGLPGEAGRTQLVG